MGEITKAGFRGGLSLNSQETSVVESSFINVSL